MAAVGQTVPDPLDHPGAAVPAALDDPGTASAPVAAAVPTRARPSARPVWVPPNWARATLGGAALDAPVPGTLPAAAPADPAWARAVLGAAQLR